MKALLLTAALALLAVSASAQSITNIQVRFTPAGQTGSTNATLTLDVSNKKDAVRIAGLQFAYASYTNSLATNVVPAAFDNWLKQNYLDFIKSYADQKQAADNAITLQKITLLLTVNSDLLSNADLSSLATIAAKAP